MKSEKSLLQHAEEDIHSLVKIHPGYWKSPRYAILLEFCKYADFVLSVGCGPKEPTIINATHAVDITPLSEMFLRRAAWPGEFKVGSCTSIPYPDKFFDVVVCSEVIEHLPNLEDVKKTFLEVSRVGKNWIITTPNSAIINPKDQNVHHQLFFTPESLEQIIPVPHKLFTNDQHIYIAPF